MNYKDFGILIKALRKDHLDSDNHFWTQQKLAEETGFSKAIISELERGKYKVINADMLKKLAHAFQLTSGERQAFFAAASGVDNEDIALRKDDPQTILQRCLQIIGQLAVPAFVVDAYQDVIAANKLALALLGMESDMAAPRENYPNPINIFDFICGPDINLNRTYRTDTPNTFIYSNIMIFRTRSLPYRATPYFQHLFKRLYTYPLFRQHWRQAYEDQSDQFELCNLRVDSPLWGELLYFATAIQAVTPFATLEVVTYAPATLHTQQVFNQLVEMAGFGAEQVSMWPEKLVSE